MKNNSSNIRNFAIIAHIDHGKSTLADRMMENTGAISKREMTDRVMDTLELEQERGITIKLQTARMIHKYKGDKYILNLIDTPGHVDFSYEVARSLAAAEGAILLVDATQGIQAQTLTTVYKAFEYDLEIIPVINKVDLPNAEIEEITKDLKKVFGFNEDEILHTSGKTGLGVDALLDIIVEKVPPAEIKTEAPTRALIYDTFYHDHKGVVALVRVREGKIAKGEELYSLGSKKDIEPIEVGYLTPNMIVDEDILAGEVGYIATGLKDIRSLHVGDTLVQLTDKDNKLQPLPGYSPPKPMVFASLYPVDAADFAEFQDALEKLALNDAALTYNKETSQALGSGYLCGFLGLLHLEITQERLEREYEIDLITTSPTVEYQVKLTTDDLSKLENVNAANLEKDILYTRTASEFPEPNFVESVEEPWVKLEILTPDKYIGSIMELAKANRAEFNKMEYVSDQQIEGRKHVTLSFEMPTAEIVTNFFDHLKSISQGYASMDYSFIEYRVTDVVKVNVLVNYEVVEALSFLTHRSNAESKGRNVVAKLKDLIPRQQFKIPIQAAINQKVIARETIQAYRKDVTAKLYGGDITRKKKLLEKQKKGKRKMKRIGSIDLPKDVFLKALKTD